MKNIVWKRPDGGVTVTTIGPKPTLAIVKSNYVGISDKDAIDLLGHLLAEWPSSSQHHTEQLMQRAMAWNNLNYPNKHKRTSWFAVAFDVDLPNDKDFRNAWEHGAAGVTINMSKAQEIHRDMLRGLRAPKLAALDVAYVKADEVGDAVLKKQIAVKKQALRDATADPRIAAATTPEQLKAVIPDVLT